MAGLGGEAEMLLATLLEEGISEAADSPESTMAWPTDLMHETLAPDSTTPSSDVQPEQMVFETPAMESLIHVEDPVPAELRLSSPEPSSPAPPPLEDLDLALEQATLPDAVKGGAEGPEPPPIPVVQADERIWPWPAADPWTLEQLKPHALASHHAVVEGRTSEANRLLDHIGPHLDGHLSMLYHIGTVLKAVGRVKDLDAMLDAALRLHPSDDTVRNAAHALRAVRP